MSEAQKGYTSEEINEMQDWNHDQTFVTIENYLELKERLEAAERKHFEEMRELSRIHTTAIDARDAEISRLKAELSVARSERLRTHDGKLK